MISIALTLAPLAFSATSRMPPPLASMTSISRPFFPLAHSLIPPEPVTLNLPLVVAPVAGTKLAMIMPSGPMRALTIALSAFVLVRVAPNILTAIGVGILRCASFLDRLSSRVLLNPAREATDMVLGLDAVPVLVQPMDVAYTGHSARDLYRTKIARGGGLSASFREARRSTEIVAEEMMDEAAVADGAITEEATEVAKTTTSAAAKLAKLSAEQRARRAKLAMALQEPLAAEAEA